MVVSKLKKSIFLLLSLSLFSVSALIPTNYAHANVQVDPTFDEKSFYEELQIDPEAKKAYQQLNDIFESKEFKTIQEALKQYGDLIYSDETGYHFKEGAEKEIPEETYVLLEEVFNSANEEFTNEERRTLENRVSPLGVTEDYYYGHDDDTYVYSNGDWDVGEWWYFSDDDTRWLVEKLAIAATISWFAGKILSLFPATKGLGLSLEVASVLFGLGATYIANKNKGYGIYVRIYSGGVYMRARTY